MRSNIQIGQQTTKLQFYKFLIGDLSETLLLNEAEFIIQYRTFLALIKFSHSASWCNGVEDECWLRFCESNVIWDDLKDDSLILPAWALLIFPIMFIHIILASSCITNNIKSTF